MNDLRWEEELEGGGTPVEITVKGSGVVYSCSPIKFLTEYRLRTNGGEENGCPTGDEPSDSIERE